MGMEKEENEKVRDYIPLGLRTDHSVTHPNEEVSTGLFFFFFTKSTFLSPPSPHVPP
jgi:hypothetical protein